MSEFQSDRNGRYYKESDWRCLFDANTIKQIETSNMTSHVIDFTDHVDSLSCTYKDGTRYYNVLLSRIPTELEDTWSQTWGFCTCPKCYGERCIHIGAMLMYREMHYGPFLQKESDHAFNARQAKEKKAAEIQRRNILRTTLGTRYLPVLQAIGTESRIPSLVMYDFASILDPLKTSEYSIARVSEIMNDATHTPNIHVSESISRDGIRELTGKLDYWDEVGYCSARMIFHPKSLAYSQCNCTENQTVLCEHKLLLTRAARTFSVLNAPSDLTDQAAMTFFSSLEKNQSASSWSTTLSPEKEKKIIIVPRISVEDASVKLSFKIGHVGNKQIVLRNLYSLMQAYRDKTRLMLSKKETIDFATEDFMDDSIPVFSLIMRKVSEIMEVNSQLLSKDLYSAALNCPYQQDLSGSLLDQFYDAAEGLLCEYHDKSNRVVSTIHVGHRDMSFTVYVDRLGDAHDSFSGVAVSGTIPLELHGCTNTYILSENALSRINQKEASALLPFRSVADASGFFRFHIGLSNLQEFYYRVIPDLVDRAYVHLVDHCEEEASLFLPPEPFFAFYCNISDSVLSIKATATYDEKCYPLTPNAHDSSEYHDTFQEQRVTKIITQYAGQFNPDQCVFYSTVSEDELFIFLRDGINDLSRYGIVNGTDSFRSLRIHHSSQMTVGISIESDLLNLSINSPNMSEDELLSVLESYQKKQKYYRLHSGDFLDLEQCNEIEEVLSLFHSLDLVPTHAIKQKLHLPLFRSLFLDRLLEEHKNLVSSRDRTYRSLVKNFKTVTDADYEIPSSLETVLRPYQSYGFKWLTTLERSGFGGILADEMGLGKTIQVISLLLSDKENGIHTPSLVVCPASLVYNWQEEIHQFASELVVATLTGPQSIRSQQLVDLKNRSAGSVSHTSDAFPLTDCSNSTSAPDVYITSYDTLKRDIEYYEELRFHTCILDEAQYIKNQNSVISKSVKVIHAEHRCALTGTPIENRLSELWSIFDFLMPGFLYSSADFINRFETPITKYKDEKATMKLKQMIGPFVLRRRKEDVLKDLPAKLEEVRYAKFDKDQQMLYDAQVLHMKKTLEKLSDNGTDKLKILAELTHLRQICCDPSLHFEDYHGHSAKREACIELIEAAIDAGHRMLVFSQFTSMLSLLEEDLKKQDIQYYKITGSTSKEQRLELVHSFNCGTVPVFLISLKAGGTGLNLTGADVVIHYDPWWNVAAQNQATDRAHRIGQTRQVTEFRLIVKGTIEEKILNLQNAKKDLADAIIEGRNTSLINLTKDELLDLLS
ncbi:MAG: DEAD/DEAH box helicase [Clostridia bacterium]|nr:DEAD/DEAH box helicase [Clostridia bacterium]